MARTVVPHKCLECVQHGIEKGIVTFLSCFLSRPEIVEIKIRSVGEASSADHDYIHVRMFLKLVVKNRFGN